MERGFTLPFGPETSGSKERLQPEGNKGGEVVKWTVMFIVHPIPVKIGYTAEVDANSYGILL